MSLPDHIYELMVATQPQERGILPQDKLQAILEETNTQAQADLFHEAQTLLDATQPQERPFQPNIKMKKKDKEENITK